MTKTTSKANDLLTLIDTAAQADLDELDAEIKAVESRLDGLKTVRTIIARRLGVTPPPAPRGGAARKAKEVARAVRAQDDGEPAPAAAKPAAAGALKELILAEIALNGHKTVGELVKILGKPYPSVYAAANESDWFEKDAGGGKVRLTSVGWAAAKERGVGSKPAVA
jgi:hypothetical protein